MSEYAVVQLVEALPHKPEGRGFDSRRTMTLVLTQLLKEMSTSSYFLR